MHQLSGLMEKWWAEHGSRWDDPEWKTYLHRYNELLIEKHKEFTEEHQNVGADGTPRFGMSGAGGCTRKASLRALGYRGDPLSGSVLTTFHIGHLVEVMAIATLERVGCKIDGVQKKVYLEPVMASASDGIIVSGPGIDKPTVLSIKSMGYKMSAKRKGNFVRQGFACLPIDGIRKANPGYWVQAQAEMGGHDIGSTLVVVVAKDMIKTMEGCPYMQKNGSLTFYCEEIQKDEMFIAELLQAWIPVKSKVDDKKPAEAYVYNKDKGFILLPAPGEVDPDNIWGGPNQLATGTYNPCGGCDMAKICLELK